MFSVQKELPPWQSISGSIETPPRGWSPPSGTAGQHQDRHDSHDEEERIQLEQAAYHEAAHAAVALVTQIERRLDQPNISSVAIYDLETRSKIFWSEFGPVRRAMRAAERKMKEAQQACRVNKASPEAREKSRAAREALQTLDAARSNLRATYGGVMMIKDSIPRAKLGMPPRVLKLTASRYEKAMQATVIALAGMAAETRLRGSFSRSVLGGKDSEDARACAADVYADIDEQRRFLAAARRKARRLVDEHWVAIAKLASQLLVKYRMGRAAVLRLIGKDIGWGPRSERTGDPAARVPSSWR